MENLDQYRISSSKQILANLQLLMSGRCLISAEFGKDERVTFLTAILEIDKARKFMMIDCGPKEYLNKKLLNSTTLRCSTEYKGIKVEFQAKKVQKAGDTKQMAFKIPVPDSMLWVERRQFYRVKCPMTKGCYCQFSMLNAKKQQITLKLPLCDVSATGFSMINEDKALKKLLNPEKAFKYATLVLSQDCQLPVSFQIRNKSPLNPNEPLEASRLGCEILMLTPRMESTILREMQEIERGLLQKSRN